MRGVHLSGGDATLPRRPPPDAAAEALGIDYVYLRDNPRRAAIASSGITRGGCRAWLVVTRDTLHPRGLASVAARGRHRSARHDQPYRLPTAARSTARARCALHLRRPAADAALPATRWPRRCSPTASRWSGASFKYHRPRGVLTAGLGGAERAGRAAATGGRREPNTRATTVELYRRAGGARARTAGRRSPSTSAPSTASLSPLLVAGFYYKTFMWPTSFWEKVYEPLIRRAAGLGRARDEPDPDHYEKAYAHCDVLVIGAGPGRADGGAGGRPRRRARHPRRRRLRARRHAARRTRARSTASPAGDWARASRPSWRRCRTSR